MGEVSLEMVWKRLGDIEAEVESLRGELARLGENVATIARSQVTMQHDTCIVQRDFAELKDRVTVLTIASGDDDRPHA